MGVSTPCRLSMRSRLGDLVAFSFASIAAAWRFRLTDCDKRMTAQFQQPRLPKARWLPSWIPHVPVSAGVRADTGNAIEQCTPSAVRA